MTRIRLLEGTYVVDTENGVLLSVSTEKKRNKTTEKKTRIKRIRSVRDAYDYLSEVYKKPVWKLRALSKKEAQK